MIRSAQTLRPPPQGRGSSGGNSAGWPAALELVARGTIRPDLVLADYNLANRLNGVQLAAKLREKLHHETPVIILTGDISTATLRDIALHDCVQLNKPVSLRS